MLFIGNGHIHNLSSHQARLCMLRPRKFIKCQIHVKAQVSNLNGNRFMAQAERVEGSRIKAHLARWGKIKTFPFQSMNPDIAINVIKHCRIVIKNREPLLVAQTIRRAISYTHEKKKKIHFIQRQDRVGKDKPPPFV